MKKTLYAMALLMVFAITIPFLITPTPLSYAATTVSPATKPSSVPPPSSETPKTQIEYALPYPGLLPTSPLYFLKILRDQIIELMITDPLKKAEFYILQADKKINMAIFLDQANNDKEAAQALLDAVVLREKSITTLETVVGEGVVIPGFIMDKLMMSLAKHTEVATQLKAEVAQLQALLERVQSLSKPN